MRVTTAALVFAAAPAAATWSIVAVDPTTREVGIATASCIAGVEQTAGLVPGIGVMASQGIPSQRALRRGKRMIAAGASPREVLAAIANDKFDPGSFWSWRSGSRVRQYGIATLGFELVPAAYTGARTFAWSGSRTGPGFSVQGNMLRGPEVVRAAFDAYRAASRLGCFLSDRLMAALLAGSEAGGDWRCSRELTALSAHLEVARPADRPRASWLRLVVTDPRPSSASAWRFLRQKLFEEEGGAAENPVGILAAEYAIWRRATLGAADCEPRRVARP